MKKEVKKKMDRAAYEQLDRMEKQLIRLNEGIVTLSVDSSVDVVCSFYDEEVVNEKGVLHHLKDDTKLKRFIENLRNEDGGEDDLGVRHVESEEDTYNQP